MQLRDLKSFRLEWSLYQPVKLLDFPIRIVFINRRFRVQLKTQETVLEMKVMRPYILPGP